MDWTFVKAAASHNFYDTLNPMDDGTFLSLAQQSVGNNSYDLMRYARMRACVRACTFGGDLVERRRGCNTQMRCKGKAHGQTHTDTDTDTDRHTHTQTHTHTHTHTHTDRHTHTHTHTHFITANAASGGMLLRPAALLWALATLTPCPTLATSPPPSTASAPRLVRITAFQMFACVCVRVCVCLCPCPRLRCALHQTHHPTWSGLSLHVLGRDSHSHC